MPVESAADLAAFFDTETFGEPVRIVGHGIVPALYDCGTSIDSFGAGSRLADEHFFRLPDDAPHEVEMVLERIRTGEMFVVRGDPSRAEDGLGWICAAEPYAP